MQEKESIRKSIECLKVTVLCDVIFLRKCTLQNLFCSVYPNQCYSRKLECFCSLMRPLRTFVYREKWQEAPEVHILPKFYRFDWSLGRINVKSLKAGTSVHVGQNNVESYLYVDYELSGACLRQIIAWSYWLSVLRCSPDIKHLSIVATKHQRALYELVTGDDSAILDWFQNPVRVSIFCNRERGSAYRKWRKSIFLCFCVCSRDYMQHVWVNKSDFWDLVYRSIINLFYLCFGVLF